MFKVSTSGSAFCGGVSHVQRCLSVWAPRALGLEPPCPGGRSVGTRSHSPAFPTPSGVGLHCFLVEFSLSAISTSSTSAAMPCHSFTKVKKHIPKYRREKQPCSLGARDTTQPFFQTSWRAVWHLLSQRLCLVGMFAGGLALISLLTVRNHETGEVLSSTERRARESPLDLVRSS